MPNTVVKLTNAESTWLEAAREDRKLLINEKHICKDVLFSMPSPMGKVVPKEPDRDYPGNKYLKM